MLKDKIEGVFYTVLFKEGKEINKGAIIRLSYYGTRQMRN